jgi:hypothetical protein
MPTMTTKSSSLLSDDLLVGAKQISEFTGLDERQVYHQQHRLPIFSIGKMLCARKSELLGAFSAKRDGQAA